MTKHVDTFYAIDFDRCLSDTVKLDVIFYALLREMTTLDVDAIIRDRSEVEDRGGRFDQLKVLHESLSEGELSELFEAFAEEASKQDVLSDGGRELLDALAARHIPHGIVSYGEEAWQSIKLRASGVEAVPTLITGHSRKAELIATWQQSDNTFLLPIALKPDGYPVAHIVLLDDKAIAFQGLPPEARGYWVQAASGELLPSQHGDVPENVETVRGLREVIKLEAL